MGHFELVYAQVIDSSLRLTIFPKKFSIKICLFWNASFIKNFFLKLYFAYYLRNNQDLLSLGQDFPNLAQDLTEDLQRRDHDLT